MNIEKIVVGQIETNCYIVYDDLRRAIVIDCGDYAGVVLDKIRENMLTVKYIVITHGHYDHIMAIPAIKGATGAKVMISEQDSAMLIDMRKNLSFFRGINFEMESPADCILHEGDIITCGDLNFAVIETPGHTRGGICLYSKGYLFSGDTLFHESIGRTDFPGSDQETLVNSIKEKLFVLPDNTIVYPGHDEETTIANEKLRNPYIG